MRRIPLIAISSALAIVSANIQAEESWTWLAVTKDGYVAEPAISVMLGTLDPDVNGVDSDTITGIELSLNCPLVQPPSNRIRQQVSFVTYDNDGFEITSIELNPHYVIETSPGLELGFGPGLGYVMAESNGLDDSALALQLGVSAHYTAMGPLFIGAEARMQVTDDFDGGDGIDNLRVGVKVGYSF